MWSAYNRRQRNRRPESLAMTVGGIVVMGAAFGLLVYLAVALTTYAAHAFWSTP